MTAVAIKSVLCVRTVQLSIQFIRQSSNLLGILAAWKPPAAVAAAIYKYIYASCLTPHINVPNLNETMRRIALTIFGIALFRREDNTAWCNLYDWANSLCPVSHSQSVMMRLIVSPQSSPNDLVSSVYTKWKHHCPIGNQYNMGCCASALKTYKIPFKYASQK